MTRLPTTDLYFRNACSDLIAQWRRPGPVRAFGANSFICGTTLLLIRRDSEAIMRQALDWPYRLVYLLDDDIAGGVICPGLPDHYRRRLAKFNSEYHQSLIARADSLVVSSAVLGRKFAEHPELLDIDPFWSLPLADLSHFHGVGVTSPVKLVHLGSGSHGAALKLFEPAISRLLNSGRNIHFTFVARRGDYPFLDSNPRARRINPKRWPVYRRWLGHQRFHIGLYPIADTPFDRARSANKIIEHGIVGAVGVYASDWEPVGRISNGAILAPPDASDWFDILAATIDNISQLKILANDALQQLPEINSKARQRFNWCKILGIDPN